MLPIYDSMIACEAAVGIPVSVQRQAKKGGCDAFRSNRVDLARLIRWLFKGGTDDDVDWGQELKKVQTKRERIKLSKDEGSVMATDEVREGIQRGVGLMFGELDRVFCSELPPALKGLDELAIRTRCQGEIERIKETLRDKFNTVTPEVVEGKESNQLGANE